MTPALPPALTHVVLGVARHEQRVLVAWRDARRHQGGCLELPGGKVRPGESPAQALCREWMEEVGVAVAIGAPLICFKYDYDDRRLLIDVREVLIDPDAVVGPRFAWRHIKTLSPSEFPPANRAIISALKLPPMYAISSTASALEQRLEKLLAEGVRLILFRAKELDDNTYLSFAKRFVARTRRVGAQLLLHDYPQAALVPGAAGIHLSQSAFAKAHALRPVSPEHWFAVSCHNLEEMRRAEAAGADFCVLGPVKPTPGHATPLGFHTFAKMVGAARIPVYALGGLCAENLGEARLCGAQGIAGIRCFGL